MDEARAREILGNVIKPNGTLYLGNDNPSYISWGNIGDRVYLDGGYSAETLEAIAWWMRNKTVNH